MKELTFDLTSLSSEKYRTARRLPRWLCTAGAIVIFGLVAYRLLYGPYSALFGLGYAIGLAAASFCAWMAAFGLRPGPLMLALQSGSIVFRFQGDREISYTRREAALRFDFQSWERRGTRGAGSATTEFYVRDSINVYPLSRESFDAAGRWLREAGYEPVERQSRLAGRGWKTIRYKLVD